MKFFTNPLQQSETGSRPGLLLLIVGVVLLLSGNQSYAGRGYYGGGRVAVAGPRGAAVAGPNGAVAVGRNGGVAVAQRSYAPCYPYGYVRVVPTGYTTVYYGGYNCYFVGGVYYRPEFYGGSTVYVVVNP
jgi:hypothetical protein